MAITLPAQGYFWTNPVTTEEEYDVQVFDCFVTTDLLDEEGNPTGETWEMPTFKTIQETRSVTRLCGETPLNWVICGEYNGKKLISVMINTGEELAMAERLKDHDDYLGTPRQIWDAAKAGNAKAILVCKNAMYTVWERLDGEGNPYNHRGTIQQWIDEGKPPRLDKFRPYTEWFQDSNVAEDDEI